jgi:hypothetical protein
MGKFDATTLRQSIDHIHPLCISLYLSTDEVGLQSTKKKVLLQNAEREVLRKLDVLQVSSENKEKIQQAIEELKKNEAVEDLKPTGLAAFISPESSQVFYLDSQVKNITLVAERFHLKPILLELGRELDFYVLSLTQDSVDLYKGNRTSLEKITVPNLPKNMVEVVGTESDGRHLQFHTSTSSPGGGSRPASFHGHSESWKDDHHRYLTKFLQAVEKAVSDFLEETPTPLLLMGAERMITEYRTITKYHLLLDEALGANDGSRSMSELHGEALAKVPQNVEIEKAFLQEIMDTGAAERFSFQLDDILRQAYLGRVQTVFVAEDLEVWGKYDAQNFTVERFDSYQAGAEDLLNLACVLTLSKGGKAFALPVEEMPEQKQAVAIFRY